jgi:phosphomannomutase
MTGGIRFGTDGWRGVISEDFTEENLILVVSAFGRWLRDRNPGARPTVAVGYDLRFGSERFARLAARTLGDLNIHGIVSDRTCPTPLISHIIQNRNLDGGLIVTASHNPYRYNGVKLRLEHGISPPDDVLEEIRSLLEDGPPPKRPASELTALVSEEDLTEEYLASLVASIDDRVISGLVGTVAVDYQWGVLQGWLERIFEGTRLRVVALRDYPDATFGGGSPEPVAEKLDELKRVVIRQGALLGVAFDGDGDRIAVVDDRGRILTAQELFPLLLAHLYWSGRKGGVARTYPTTDRVKRVADEAGERTFDVPVGFKYLSPLLVRREAIMAGEESGGIAFAHHIPERDALFVFLVLVELIYEARAPLSDLISRFAKRYGDLRYERKDLTVERGGWLKKAQMDFVDAVCQRLGATLEQKNDGLKFRIRDGEWVMVRESGTEPVLRIYAESETEETLRTRMGLVESLARETGAPIAEHPASE